MVYSLGRALPKVSRVGYVCLVAWEVAGEGRWGREGGEVWAGKSEGRGGSGNDGMRGGDLGCGKGGTRGRWGRAGVVGEMWEIMFGRSACGSCGSGRVVGEVW